ncbi:MAG: exodeoxyribonuclease VII large subunit [Ruminococcus sp.]|nr:exodeoxyribonuclease VII large subunit [Ruminococcus sp.]
MYTPEFTKPKILSVSQLNFYIKSIIENDSRLNFVFLTGEISNLTDHYKSGHIYLSLKDEKSIIKAVMFAGNACRLKFKPQNGMKVICRGRVALYEPSGQYQLYIEDMQPDGIGSLTIAYDQLKKSLEDKGLFDSKHKKPVPEFPKTVGVITSPTGAAVQDIKNILYRRFPCIDVVLCPVLVQGENAPKQLVEAVRTLDENNACDVIIIGRGGGSIEDLWAFNSEELAYAIYNCKIPVISAVGHETDFTICDFVSDLRAPTPSAAAELAVPDKSELLENYNTQYQYISSMLDLKINSCSKNLSELKSRVAVVSPTANMREFEHKLNDYLAYFQGYMYELISEKENQLKNSATSLNALNPVSVLARGYAIAEKNGKAINSAKKLKVDDEFTLEFADGKINAKCIGE